MTAALRFFLIAGEPSGDRLGADLMRGLKVETGGEATFHGLGGPLMEREGLNSLFPIDELSIMGLAEILPRVPALLRRIRETAEAVTAFAPDALITIDSPDFCLRVARRARAAVPELRTIHYVAPSVWAWRPGRAAKMARVIDHVLALLPFEPPYMEAAGMTCDFVGHPVASAPISSAGLKTAVRRELGLAEEVRVVCLLPGSRGSEVARHGPLFRQVAERLAMEDPGLRFVLPTVGPRLEQVRTLFDTSLARPVILGPEDLGPEGEAVKSALFALSDAALAASGTVSVELAAAGCPMVVAYRTSALTTFLARRMVKVDHVSLVNILLGREVVPEFLAEAATADALGDAMHDLLSTPSQAAAQRQEFEAAMTALGRGGPPCGVRAARSVLSAIG